MDIILLTQILLQERQIPCIERNAIGVGKAINASRMAMLNENDTKISLDDNKNKSNSEDMKSKKKKQVKVVWQ